MTTVKELIKEYEHLEYDAYSYSSVYKYVSDVDKIISGLEDIIHEQQDRIEDLEKAINQIADIAGMYET